MKKSNRTGLRIVGQEEVSAERMRVVVEDDMLEESDGFQAMKLKIRKHKQRFWKIVIASIVIVLLLGAGLYFFLKYRTYGNIRIEEKYENQQIDNSNYIEYARGILKYSRDGVVFLDKEGKEIWNQSCQMQNPVVEICDETAVVGDKGGTSILVIQRDGLKGEIHTSSPIQKLTVSQQGIVGAVLEAEAAPKVVCYDAKGNILVEHKTSLANTGYPIDIAVSDDGDMLLISYLCVEGNSVATKIAYYNFGESGKEKKDHQVAEAKYDDTLIPTVFFMDRATSVLVGNDVLIFYKGANEPQETERISLEKEIISLAYDKKGIALVLKNSGKAGYELRVYDTVGKLVMSTDFEGQYGNIKMSGNQIILYDGNRCSIFNKSGVHKYEGQLEVNVIEMFPVVGLNKYMVISANELQKIRLVK